MWWKNMDRIQKELTWLSELIDLDLVIVPSLFLISYALLCYALYNIAYHEREQHDEYELVGIIDFLTFSLKIIVYTVCSVYQYYIL